MKIFLRDSYVSQANTVRPLIKKNSQHCETYEPTNCCVRKLHNLCTILNKLCNFFYTTVGRFICFTVLCNFLNSGLTVNITLDAGVSQFEM